MRWYHLILPRAVLGLALDIWVLAPRDLTPIGWFFPIATLSGIVGYWYARRVEMRHDLDVTVRRALLVWVGTAPEALAIIPASAVGFFAIFLESGPAADNAVYWLWLLPQLTVSIALQALATWLWAVRVRRSRGQSTGQPRVSG